MTEANVVENYHAFISYSHADGEWVQSLADRLADEKFRIWLDSWVIIPGEEWQQQMALGLENANCCIVCVGEDTPSGWFEQEIQKALNRQAQEKSFRVIPVLLPNADSSNVTGFLNLRSWVDFGKLDPEHAFYLIFCGIKGVRPGRWPPKKDLLPTEGNLEEKFRRLKQLEVDELIHREVAQDYQRILLNLLLIKEEE